MSIWDSLKDRVLKYDTIHGLYMVPLGIVGLWVVVFHFQYILHIIGALVFLYAIIEGIKKIIKNPAKYEAKLQALSKKYQKIYEHIVDGNKPQQ